FLLIAFLGNVVQYGVQFLMELMARSVGEPVVAGLLAAVSFVFVWLFNMWLSVGQALLFLRIARGDAYGIADLFAGGPYLLRFLGATVVVSLAAGAAGGLGLLPGGVAMVLTEPGSPPFILGAIVGGGLAAAA